MNLLQVVFFNIVVVLVSHCYSRLNKLVVCFVLFFCRSLLFLGKNREKEKSEHLYTAVEESERTPLLR